MNGKKRAQRAFQPDLNPLEERVVLSSVAVTERAAHRQQIREQQQLLREQRAESRLERRLLTQEQRANQQHERALLLQERRSGLSARAARIAARATSGARSMIDGTPALASVQTSAASSTPAGNVRARNAQAALTQVPGTRAFPVSRGAVTANLVSSVRTATPRATAIRPGASSVLNGNQIAAVNSFPNLTTTALRSTTFPEFVNVSTAPGTATALNNGVLFNNVPTAPGTATNFTGVNTLTTTPGTITTGVGTTGNVLTIPSFSNSTINPLSGSALNTLNLAGNTGTLANTTLNTTGTLNGSNPNIIQSLQSGSIPLTTGVNAAGLFNPAVNANGINPSGIVTTGINNSAINTTGISTTGASLALSPTNAPLTSGLFVNPTVLSPTNTAMIIPSASGFANGTLTAFPTGPNVSTASNTIFIPNTGGTTLI